MAVYDISTTWSYLRTIVDDKHLPIQYKYDTDGYNIFAVDNDVVYRTVVYNNSVPDPSLYSQAQNDSDKSDFLANYQPTANRIMQAFAARDGYTTNVYPILQGGTDGGGIVRIIKTDTSSRQLVVGAGTAGAGVGGVLTVQGDPAGTALPVSGSVTVTQSTASNLNAQVQGVAADGTAVTGNPVLVGGQDGTNVQSLATDGYGSLLVASRNVPGSPPSSNPVLIAGWDGTNVVRLRLNSDGTVATSESESATFTALATGTAIANNKSMFSIVNASGSAVVVKLSSIYITNVQISSVTGVTGTFELRRITNHSGGTAITAIETMDTTNSLSGSVTVRTGAAVTSESATLLWRSLFSTDEWGPGTADVESNDHIFQTMFPVWSRHDKRDKTITLNANEGLTVKFATNSTAGTFDVMVVFTQI